LEYTTNFLSLPSPAGAGSGLMKNGKAFDELSPSKMRHLLTILMICLAIPSYSQIVRDIEYFHSVKNNNDSTLKYFQSFLNKFDSGDGTMNFICGKASERVGDYYKAKHDYLKAIAYYDSADTKYAFYPSCGNGYYIGFIPRRFKTAECYMELKNAKKAILTLTPYIFHHLASEYFDSTMTIFYEKTLAILYSKPEIQCELQSAIDNIQYNTYYRWALDSSDKYLNISCKLRLFDSELEMAGYETTGGNGKFSFYSTKEFFITQFEELEIYKRLRN
jgi:tetratricopeptide (TPR) repeat protein